MNLVWGIVLIIFGLFAWIGQFLSATSPKKAAQWGLTDKEHEVDSTFWADVRGEAVWDSITLWTLPAAGALLMMNSSIWTTLGLAGGGMYLYFAGRGILVRLAMRRRNISIGKPASLTAAFIFLTIWGVIALVTIAMAMSALHEK
jgi:hypothetical protein